MTIGTQCDNIRLDLLHAVKHLAGILFGEVLLFPRYQEVSCNC